PLKISQRQGALAALAKRDWPEKLAAVRALDESAEIDASAVLHPVENLPGRPAQPLLVAPAQVKQRSVQTTEGRAALLHALAHIEFNAINLALDAVWRYPGLPDSFYLDWLRVAREEAHHFE